MSPLNPRFSTYRSTADDSGGGGDATPPPALKNSPVPAATVANPPADPLPVEPERTLRHRLSPWLQYLYFLRFPLLGWLALPVLCLLDGCSGASAYTRGILTMSRGWQVFHTTFFTIALLMAVLVCAKNIVINGHERFASRPPYALFRVLRSGHARTMAAVLAVAQLPALVTLIYVGRLTVVEQTGWARYRPDAEALLDTVWPRGGMHWRLYVAFGWGLLATAVFWYLVSVFYHWGYPAPGTPSKKHRRAVPLIFPVYSHPRHRSHVNARYAAPTPAHAATTGSTGNGLTHLATLSEKPWFAQWLEFVASKLLWLTRAGYADKEGNLWELHFFSIVSLAAIVTLYLFLYALVAPVVVSQGIGAEPVLALLFFIAFAVGALTHSHHRMQAVGWLFTAIMFASLVTFYSFFWKDGHDHRILMETSFPTLGAILVILIFFEWLMSGASFLMDRYRVPVLTVVLAFIFLPKLLPASWIDQEHYFDVREIGRLTESQVDSPAQAVAHRLRPVGDSAQPDIAQAGTGQPMVIVTAMGGGIQAAEWTAQIMARMEAVFRRDPELARQQYTLHDHLLLASGVSGGSVGLMPYLLEYTAPPGRQFEAADAREARLLRERLTAAPGCSGLEAVAWGLEYYDLQRLLLTARFSWFQTTLSGAAPDRTWALTEALNRNLHDKDCGTDNFAPLPQLMSADELTLAQSAQRLQQGAMPAFTFNTTVAETGDRFLLSNYAIPPNCAAPPVPGSPLRQGSDFLPAESFLQAYTEDAPCSAAGGGASRFADLPLATAARLSATFPVVSSGTRLPRRFAPVASHFLDGGYFDNDGTASAVEFLYAAMKEREAARSDAPGSQPAPLNILLVEIRDSDDMNSAINDDDLAHQTGRAVDLHGSAPPKRWGTFAQIGAPLEGMWNAGHKSTTRRNRRELCLLEHAYDSHGLHIHHVVFGIPSQEDTPADPAHGKPATYKASPLSWKLTESQKEYIRHWTNDEPSTNASMDEAVGWLQRSLRHAPTTGEVCTVEDQPTR